MSSVSKVTHFNEKHVIKANVGIPVPSGIKRQTDSCLCFLAKDRVMKGQVRLESRSPAWQRALTFPRAPLRWHTGSFGVKGQSTGMTLTDAQAQGGEEGSRGTS